MLVVWGGLELVLLSYMMYTAREAPTRAALDAVRQAQSNLITILLLYTTYITEYTTNKVRYSDG